VKVWLVYPALREDPANESGRHPIRFRPGGFTFEIETPGGGLYYLLYQAIEELGRVLVLDGDEGAAGRSAAAIRGWWQPCHCRSAPPAFRL
jgi:hypothetical protein